MKLQKLDLSYLSNNSRLSADEEAVILSALVYFSGNSSRVARYYNCAPTVVDKVFNKYFLQLQELIKNNNDNNQQLDQTIDTIIKMLYNHVQKLATATNDGILNSSATNNICRILDRLIKLQQFRDKQNSDNINAITNSINNYKDIDLKEHGELVDSSDYDANRSSVFDLLKNYNNSNDSSDNNKVVK